MASRREFLSPDGLRLDGRRPHELRTTGGQLGVLPALDGSALFEAGNTRILTTVSGPREPRSKGGAEHDRATVSVRLRAAALSSAGGERRQRRAAGGAGQARQDRRMVEWSRTIEEIFSSAIITSIFPRSTIDISIDVLNADGGVLPAAINCVTLALISAGIPLYDYVQAVSVCYLAQRALVDANRLEEGGGAAGGPATHPTLTVASFGQRAARTAILYYALDGGGSASGGGLAADQLESMTSAASDALARLFALMDGHMVRDYSLEMAAKNALASRQ